MVKKDNELKSYPYLSRYASIPTFYNQSDNSRYYGTVKQLVIDGVDFIEHTLLREDTLDTLALRYYNTPLYWWIIADFNRIRDTLNLNAIKTVKIPNLRDIKFK